ncbi:MAG: glutamyl-tRNA reductase [Lachnospiraceae bacterium]|nr:glutamyl-tRNA reductase [Agathobacter sp.]MDD6292095.1 glutamyl-tRNA reductase [Lachnospiraceae bacterium]
MEFAYIGINYKDANQDIRDRVSFTDNQKIDFMNEAAERGIDQCMVVSTCNRSEVFFLVPDGSENVRETMHILYEETFADVNLSSCIREKGGREALSYLFRVTAGLESMVLGEDQILGQVRDAYELSRTIGCTGKELNKVVRDAVTCAKKMKTMLHISETPLSVSYIGIQQLREQVGIEGRRVLVVGSGKTAVLALRYLYEYGAKQVTVCSRTFAHARELLSEFPKLLIVPFEKRYDAMQDCEIVVSATSSPHHVIRKKQLQGQLPLAFLDLASPRDIETAIGEDALLFNLDSLEKIVDGNRQKREKLVGQGQLMIDEALEETEEWLGSIRVDATIESLQQRCEEIVGDSYEYLNRKLDLSPREQKILKKILKASLHRLLREPILELKQIQSKEQQEEYERVLRELFQIQ